MHSVSTPATGTEGPAAAGEVTEVVMAPEIRRILESPAFAELRRRRRRFSLLLTALMLAIYYGFVLMIAFAPAVLATPINAVITLGIPLGLGVIAAAIGLTGLYVWQANRVFDGLTAAALRSAKA